MKNNKRIEFLKIALTNDLSIDKKERYEVLFDYAKNVIDNNITDKQIYKEYFSLDVVKKIEGKRVLSFGESVRIRSVAKLDTPKDNNHSSNNKKLTYLNVFITHIYKIITMGKYETYKGKEIPEKTNQDKAPKNKIRFKEINKLQEKNKWIYKNAKYNLIPKNLLRKFIDLGLDNFTTPFNFPSLGLTHNLDFLTDKYGQMLKNIQALAKENNPDAKFFLGIIYHEGNLVKKDNAKAIKLLKEAVLLGCLISYFYLKTNFSNKIKDKDFLELLQKYFTKYPKRNSDEYFDFVKFRVECIDDSNSYIPCYIYDYNKLAIYKELAKLHKTQNNKLEHLKYIGLEKYESKFNATDIQDHRVDRNISSSILSLTSLDEGLSFPPTKKNEKKLLEVFSQQKTFNKFYEEFKKYKSDNHHKEMIKFFSNNVKNSFSIINEYAEPIKDYFPGEHKAISKSIDIISYETIITLNFYATMFLNLEKKEKELEQKNKELEKKNEEIQDLMGSFQHMFRSQVGSIQSNAEHANNPIHHMQYVQTMFGILDVFKFLSVEKSDLISMLQADNNGKSNLKLLLKNVLNMLIQKLLLNSHTKTISHHYYFYAKKTKKIEKNIDISVWDDDGKFRDLEQEIRSEWESEYNNLLKKNITLDDILKFCQKNFFKIDLQGFDNRIKFDEYGVTSSWLAIIMTEIITNIFKYYYSSSNEKAILKWQDDKKHQHFISQNPSDEIQSGSGGKGLIMLDRISKRTQCLFKKIKNPDEYIVEYVFLNKLLKDNE
ncbi:MAG: hypothetical protein DRQ51_09350 [Gammaproteobacteria bacterium]|nr:MAG: hypothetical protein DRQ51_09350 [Gammaproteobacteria bacterium]